MPIKFADICVLFDDLENEERRYPPRLAADKSGKLCALPHAWFTSHRRAISELKPEGAAALLSTLLPERRTDRVYGIQSRSLCRVLSRALNLPGTRAKDLQAYTEPGRGDLATCLERVLEVGGPPALPAVSLGDVDELLRTLAGQCRFSAPAVRLPPGSSEARNELLGRVFRRVSATEGKWLVRLLLKDLSPVKIDEELVLSIYHFLLPVVLRFQNDLELAVSQLRAPELADIPAQPDPRSQPAYRDQAASKLKPVVGVKVGRPHFHKARSIDHCMKIIGSQPWVLERKYDGEYCEVHIDLTKSTDVTKCITIFSKSGKDSTTDRKNIHATLVNCLSLGQPDCKIKRQAILLGELVVFSDHQEEPLPFEKLRRHVSRSGSFLGMDADSMPSSDEHLGIVFFDLLLHDDELVLNKSVEERRNWLREVYMKQHKRARSAEWKLVDFSGHGDAARQILVKQFAASIAARREGLVLKPCGVPYFSLAASSASYKHSFTKLKKDYIVGAGDEADVAVVGASYNTQQACGVPDLKYTEFFMGCLKNQAEVRRFGAMPIFKLVGTIKQNMCIPKPVLRSAITLGSLFSKPFGSSEATSAFTIELGQHAHPDVVFTTPLVFEVLGSGFERAPNARHSWLRHARVKKLHLDRNWQDCVSFQGLQEQAEASRVAPPDSESQDALRWIAKLEGQIRKKFERERTRSPRSATTATTTPGTDRTGIFIDTAPVAMPLTRNGHSAARDSPGTPLITTSSSMKLSGTTLVETQTRSKRPRTTETPCPAKRLCLAVSAAHPVPTCEEAAEISVRPPRLSKKIHCGNPLGDITNTVSGRLSTTSGVKARPKEQNSVQSRLGRPEIRSYLKTGQSDVCESSACLFAKAVVYLAPCISKALYIVDDLIPSHGCAVVDDLNHWNREAFAHPILTETVSESQAYAGLRKLVLVEAKRRLAVEAIIDEIENLNDGKSRERVEVYDWRVLEACQDIKRFLFGATVWDGGKQRACLVRNPTFAI